MFNFTQSPMKKSNFTVVSSQVESILLNLVRNKAHARLVSNVRPSLRRQLTQGKSLPTYMRKLMHLPQDWQIEDEKRRILKAEMAKPKEQRRNLQEASVYAMAVGSAADQMSLMAGSGTGDSDNAMFTPEQAAKVEPMEEVAQFMSAECG